jgi:hypothetical protein
MGHYFATYKPATASTTRLLASIIQSAIPDIFRHSNLDHLKSFTSKSTRLLIATWSHDGNRRLRGNPKRETEAKYGDFLIAFTSVPFIRSSISRSPRHPASIYSSCSITISKRLFPHSELPIIPTIKRGSHASFTSSSFQSSSSSVSLCQSPCAIHRSTAGLSTSAGLI